MQIKSISKRKAKRYPTFNDIKLLSAYVLQTSGRGETWRKGPITTPKDQCANNLHHEGGCEPIEKKLKVGHEEHRRLRTNAKITAHANASGVQPITATYMNRSQTPC